MMKFAAGKLKFELKVHSHFKEYIIRFSSKYVVVIIYCYYQLLNCQNIYSTIGENTVFFANININVSVYNCRYNEKGSPF